MKSDINNYLHKFSKAVVAEGQLYESQASTKSGHNVDYVTVRANDVPECKHKEALLNSSKKVIGAYSSVLKYWNKFVLTEYPKSNGETFYLIDEEGNAISDFIDPSDKLINGRQLSRGYTAEVYGYKSDTDDIGEKISPMHYEFESYSGILYFNKGTSPKELGYTRIAISAFSYIGKNVKQNFRDVEQLIAMNLMLLQKITAERIVVQPYKFSTANMTTVWETAKPVPGAFNRFGKQMWSQRFKITVPGYVFEVSAENMYDNELRIHQNGVIIPDMTHLDNGSTIIEIELQVNAGDDIEDIGDGQIVIGYEQVIDVTTGQPKLVLKTGDLHFVASTFKRNDGQKIDIKDAITLQGKGDTLSEITPELKKQLLVDQYLVDFTPGTVDKASIDLFDKLYEKRQN